MNKITFKFKNGDEITINSVIDANDVFDIWNGSSLIRIGTLVLDTDELVWIKVDENEEN